jgi:hypothetical protein
LTLSVATFFTLYLHPMIDPLPAGSAQQPWQWKSLGMAEIAVQVALLSTVAALLIRRFVLPVGALSVVCICNGVLVTAVRPHFELLPVMVLTGLVADGGHLLSRRVFRDLSTGSVVTVGLIGVTYVLAYWGFIQLLDGGTWWRPGLWLGMVLAAGLIGSVVCGLIAVPAAPANDPRAGAAPEVGSVTPAVLKRALESLRDPETLAALPLARTLGMDGPTQAVATELHRRLLAGIDSLSGSDDFRVAQAGRLLDHYYVHRIGSHEAVAARLHVSRPTFYRRLQDGLDLLAHQVARSPDEAEALGTSGRTGLAREERLG